MFLLFPSGKNFGRHPEVLAVALEILGPNSNRGLGQTAGTHSVHSVIFSAGRSEKYC